MKVYFKFKIRHDFEYIVMHDEFTTQVGDKKKYRLFN